MEKEEYKGTSRISSMFQALAFVHEHRNIFNDSTRRYKYGIVDGAYIVKEINKFREDTSRWFWAFKNEYYLVLMNVDKKTEVEGIIKEWVRDK